jgi:hypothetical protein
MGLTATKLTVSRTQATIIVEGMSDDYNGNNVPTSLTVNTSESVYFGPRDQLEDLYLLPFRVHIFGMVNDTRDHTLHPVIGAITNPS